MNDLRIILESDVVAVAQRLLGCYLVHGNMCARIVETEAYRSDEPASHSYRGETPRNRIMYGPPGHAYVYFSYGCHWMLNVVCHEPGDAAAVLIRAAEPVAGFDAMRLRRPKASHDQDLLSGPGKLCAAFGIDARFNGADLLDSNSDLRIEPGEPARVIASTRIGISQAQELEWRFLDADRLAWTSRPRPGQKRTTLFF